MMRDNKGRFVEGHKVPIEIRQKISQTLKDRGIRPRIVYKKSGKDHHAYKEKIKKECKTCGKEFEVHPCRENAKYCSLRCLYNRSKVRKECLYCGKTFSTAPSSNQKFCSKKCQGLYMRGEKHPQWKGGITRERLLFYSSIEWKEKRQEIIKRDGYKCLLCGRNTFRLEVHHIFPFSKFPELRLADDNLITLCKECHSKITGIFHPNKWIIIKDEKEIC